MKSLTGIDPKKELQSFLLREDVLELVQKAGGKRSSRLLKEISRRIVEEAE